MKIWIDCEFNDYLGPLISLALVAEDGSEFYGSLGCNNPSNWIEINVLPVIGIETVSRIEMQRSLSAYLCQYEEIHLIADWHEDIQYFCSLLTRGPGQKIQYPKITMEIKNIDSVSKIPHNALEDARAIKLADLCLKSI